MSAAPGRGDTAPFARAVLLAHALLAVVSVLLLIAFLPALGAPRVPFLYGAMYASVRWVLFALEFYAVPALFITMVFALTGPTRWGIRDAMRRSARYQQVLVWSWVLMLGAWLLVLSVASGGRA